MIQREPASETDVKFTSATTRTSDVTTGPNRIGARQLVIVVTCALIYGSLVYISRFSPQIAGIQTIYPPAAVAAPFGVWFGIWGALGNSLGNLVSAILAGRSPLPWTLAYFAQFVMAMIPAVLYRKSTISNWKELLYFEFVNAIGLVVGATLVALQLQWNGLAPRNLVWSTIWPAMMISSLLSGVVLAPPLMKVVGPYLMRLGMTTNRQSS